MAITRNMVSKDNIQIFNRSFTLVVTLLFFSKEIYRASTAERGWFGNDQTFQFSSELGGFGSNSQTVQTGDYINGYFKV